MEYMGMLEVPGMVAGLQELIGDSEPNVVKRTIRVFTNIYRHSLSLLASGELDPVKFEQSYSEVSAVSNQLIALIKTAENEGIVVHLVRYLEAAIVTHILSDLSKFPHIAKMTAPMLKKGVDALFELVNTPYVGGSAFCVAIRALFTVACYQVDMRPKVTEVAEALINSPPPNLFDHNVRSFHKTLQRNLFRLLKRAELKEEKGRLIDLMVRVGVPRKRLHEWAPRPSKKRSAPISMEDRIIFGRLSPPSLKKSKLSISNSKSATMIPNIPIAKILHKDKKMSDATAILDKILSDGIDYHSKSLDKTVSGKYLLPGRSSPLSEVSNVITERPHDNHSPSNTKENTPNPASSPYLASGGNYPAGFTSGRNSPNSSKETIKYSNNKNEVNGNFDNTFKLSSDKSTSVGSSKSCINFCDRCSLEEKSIYENLRPELAVELILTSVANLPDNKPSYIPTIQLEDLDIMKEKIAVLLAMYIKSPNALELNQSPNGFIFNKTSISPSSTSTNVTAAVSKAVISKKQNAKISNEKLFASKDIDLRNVLYPSTSESSNLTDAGQLVIPLKSINSQNMASNRIPSPSSSRDPRLQSSQSSSAISNTDPRLQSSHINRVPASTNDPRLHKVLNFDPRLRSNSSSPPSLPPMNCPPPIISVPSFDMYSAPVAFRDPRITANDQSFNSNLGIFDSRLPPPKHQPTSVVPFDAQKMIDSKSSWGYPTSHRFPHQRRYNTNGY